MKTKPPKPGAALKLAITQTTLSRAELLPPASSYWVGVDRATLAALVKEHALRLRNSKHGRVGAWGSE